MFNHVTNIFYVYIQIYIYRGYSLDLIMYIAWLKKNF